jgi:hypothetical protein
VTFAIEVPMYSCLWLTAALHLAITACADTSDGRALHAAAPGSLAAIAPMTVARAAHTATTLRDGRVLIAGGLDAAGRIAELFDPTSRTFARTGSLAVARSGHTATLLADGRVLIAGGYNGQYLNGTEIFDPTRGQFTPGPKMTSPRSGHLAVPLRDGRLLFVGGVSTGWTFLSSAELFDPRANRFESTGAMSVPRESHTAVRLPNGEVLVAGGHRGRRVNITLYASAEVYDPATAAFRATGSMARRRHKHAAVALADGRVLVTGGADERDDRGQYRDAEIYDPASGRFTAVGTMLRGRYKHDGSMVVLRDGTVLLAGGAAAPETFDPRDKTFRAVEASSPMAPSFTAVAPLASGAVLITGGYGNGGAARTDAWLYTPR